MRTIFMIPLLFYPLPLLMGYFIPDKPLVMVTYNSNNKIKTKAIFRSDFECLLEAIYWEARSETIEGMIAVANTVLNRVKTVGWPKTICGVVYQPHQFSWVFNPQREIDIHKAAFDLAKKVAAYVLEHDDVDNTDNALYYHTVDIYPPKWTKQLVPTVTLGRHIFYAQK